MSTFNVKVPVHVKKKLLKMAENAGFKNNLQGYFKSLTSETSLNDEDPGERIKQGTMKDFLPMWLNSFAENLPYIRHGNNISLNIPEGSKRSSYSELAEPMPELPDHPPSGSAIVIGRGPSIFKHKHLEMLADAIAKGEYKGFIAATDGMLVECLKRGIIPDVTLTVDGSPIIKQWYDHPLVKKYGPQLRAIFLVNIDHDAFLAARDAGMKIYWANALQDNWRENESYTRMHRLLTATPEYPNGLAAIMPGGNCGSCLWAASVDLFKRAPVALIGMDLGYPEGYNLEQTPYFSAVSETAKANNVVESFIIPQIFKEFYHPVFKEKAYADYVFQSYRKSLIEMQEQAYPWYRIMGGTINCTEGGTLFAPSITSTTFKAFLEKYKV